MAPTYVTTDVRSCSGLCGAKSLRSARFLSQHKPTRTSVSRFPSEADGPEVLFLTERCDTKKSSRKTDHCLDASSLSETLDRGAPRQAHEANPEPLAQGAAVSSPFTP